MIRVLVMIAVAGFVLSVGTLAAAVAIGGPDAIARGGWTVVSHDWDGDWSWGGHHHHRHWRERSDLGPSTTRTLAWDGGDTLDVDLPADVRYVQAPGAGSVEVTGPERLVGDIVVKNGRVRLDRDSHRFYFEKLTVVIHAPSVTEFTVAGANSLTIEDYRQKTLNLDVSGAAEVTASGEADQVELDLSGSSRADLGELRAKAVKAEVSGVARTTVAPTDSAALKVSGMGDVRLLTHPGALATDVSGGGKVRMAGGPSVTPSPSPSPSPPPPPKKSV